jgi:hypothetical protein
VLRSLEGYPEIRGATQCSNPAPPFEPRRGTRVMSICSGAFVLAAAGFAMRSGKAGGPRR